jgi:hypothetical protein
MQSINSVDAILTVSEVRFKLRCIQEIHIFVIETNEVLTSRFFSIAKMGFFIANRIQFSENTPKMEFPESNLVKTRQNCSFSVNRI